MKALHMITWTLLIIGGLNWGLTAFGWGIGNWIPASLAMIIYVLVGLSAIYEIFAHKGNCKCCAMKGGNQTPGSMGGNTGAPKM